MSDTPYTDNLIRLIMNSPEGRKIFTEEFSNLMKGFPKVLEMAEHAKDADWECVKRSMDILKKRSQSE